MKIIMVRHGQSEDNVSGVFGTYESPLSKEGVSQVKKTKEMLKAFDFKKVYYSPFRRTVETLSVLALEGIEDARIGEYNFGKFSGLDFEDIEEKYPKEYDRWISNPNEYIIKGGESLNIVYGRVQEFMEEIIKEGESVLLVTHAGIIRLVFCWVLDNIDYFLKFKVENGSINIITIDEEEKKSIHMSNYNPNSCKV